MGSQYRTRGYAPGDLVHLTVRGFNRQSIFHCDDDHREFIDTFHFLNDRMKPSERLTLHARGHMPNHQHQLVTNGDSPYAITKVMHSLKIRYANYHNMIYGKRGPVFEKPFRGKVIRDPAHIANTFVYIHLNPDASVRIANSSHGVYIGATDDARIDQSLALRTFGGREGYLRFFEDTARLRQARAAAKYRLGQ